MTDTEKYIKQQPDSVVQRLINIFDKKKCGCGCDCADEGNNNATGEPAEHNLIVGEGYPTEKTQGNLGDFYRDELTGHVFECVDIWEQPSAGETVSKKIVQWSDGPDSSYLNVNAWKEGDFGVLAPFAAQIPSALYVKRDGELEALEFFGATNENEIEAGFNAGYDYVTYADDDGFHVYYHTAEDWEISYYWVATEQQDIILRGYDEPSFHTEGKIGQTYIDDNTGKSYTCVAIKTLPWSINIEGTYLPIFDSVNDPDIKKLSVGTPFLVHSGESYVSGIDYVSERPRARTLVQPDLCIYNGVDDSGNIKYNYPGCFYTEVAFEDYFYNMDVIGLMERIINRLTNTIGWGDIDCMVVNIPNWDSSGSPFRLYRIGDIIDKPLTAYYWAEDCSPLTINDLIDILMYEEAT